MVKKTKPQAAPTPLPWECEDNIIRGDWGEDGYARVVATIDDDGPDANPQEGFIPSGEADANAALIVRAVNAHDDLRSALHRLMVGVTRKDSKTCEWYEGLEADALDEARAALRAAGEEV